MRIDRRHFLLLLAQLAAAPLPAQALSGLEGYIERTMREWGIPGVAVAVVQGDSLIYAKGFGVHRLGGATTVTPQTVFAIGSMSKSFTAAALGTLVDEGRIGWDDPVVARLPGFAMADPAVTAEITIRDLLSHRTGLPGENLVFWGSGLSRAEVVRRLRYLPLRSRPRTEFEYQNLGFITAGEVIAAVTGQSWDDAVRQRIFTPLGMVSAGTRLADLERLPDVATPHAKLDGRVQPIPWLDLANGGAAGSITANVLDMAKYARMQLRQGRFGERRVFSDSVARQMHAGAMIIPLKSFFGLLSPDAQLIQYGLGWILQDYHGRLIVSHGGQTDGMHGNLALLPAFDIGVVVLTNSSLFGYPIAISYRIFDSFLGRPEQDWSAEFQRRLAPANAAPPAGGPVRVAGTSPTINASELPGLYRQAYLGDAVVTMADGKLQLELLGRRAPLEHWHYDTYRAMWQDPMARLALALVSFDRAGSGRVRALRFDGVGEFLRQP